MSDSRTAFWTDILVRINQSTDIDAETEKILALLCQNLGYGFGFVYLADHTGTFHLQARYMLYTHNSLPESIALETALGTALFDEMQKEPHISFRGGNTDTPLKARLAALFDVRAMDLIPITFKNETMIALVGIADRRGERRVAEDDKAYTYSILGCLALNIRTGMYLKRVESTKSSLYNMLDNTGIDIYVNDFFTHEILYINKSMAAPYGGPDTMLGKKCWHALYGGEKTAPCEYCPQSHLLDAQGLPSKPYIWYYHRPYDGLWFCVFSAAFYWVDGRLAHVVTSVDITESKHNEEIIRRMAEYDHTTTLPNRGRMTTDCETYIDNGANESYVLFLDLNGFKEINDRYGHYAGDNLLRQIGEMLQASPMTKDRAYRYGGDEFVILCGRREIGPMLAFLKELFGKPWQLEGTSIFCCPSIGVAHSPLDGKQSSDVIRKADQAMYQAKNQGGFSVRFYNQGDIVDEVAYLQTHPDA